MDHCSFCGKISVSVIAQIIGDSCPDGPCGMLIGVQDLQIFALMFAQTRGVSEADILSVSLFEFVWFKNFIASQLFARLNIPSEFTLFAIIKFLKGKLAIWIVIVTSSRFSGP